MLKGKALAELIVEVGRYTRSTRLMCIPYWDR